MNAFEADQDAHELALLAALPLAPTVPCDDFACDNDAEYTLVDVSGTVEVYLCPPCFTRLQRRLLLYRRANADRRLKEEISHNLGGKPNPAPRPDPDSDLCQCGHPRNMHTFASLGTPPGCNGCAGGVACRGFEWP